MTDLGAYLTTTYEPAGCIARLAEGVTVEGEHPNYTLTRGGDTAVIDADTMLGGPAGWLRVADYVRDLEGLPVGEGVLVVWH